MELWFKDIKNRIIQKQHFFRFSVKQGSQEKTVLFISTVEKN